MCTLLGQNAAGSWILASTSDDPYVVRNQLVCARTSPHAYIAVRVVTSADDTSVPWNGMLTRGINAAGLAFTYAYVHQPGNEVFPPQRWNHDMLAHCTDVDGAITLIRESVGHVLSGNYLLADRAGNAAALEVSQTEVMVTSRNSGTLVCTNFWQQLSMTVEDKWGAETARHRSRRGSALLQSGDSEPAALFRATRDHIDAGGDAERDYGISICNHGRVEGTISGEILDPEEQRLWWTYGWPCGAYRGYETPGRVPWGRYVAFDVRRISEGGEVTTLDGQVTPLGIHLIGHVEGESE